MGSPGSPGGPNWTAFQCRWMVQNPSLAGHAPCTRHPSTAAYSPAESRPIEKTSRKVVPMEGLWGSQQEFKRQLDAKAGEGNDGEEEDDE
jgi:hypothetical protein